jgi:multiple sugar transport system permease protein/cellobiose transport system permease protein
MPAARLREQSWGYIFLAPTVIALTAFTIYPLAAVLQISFTNSNGVSGQFVGLANYDFIFHDPQFWRSIANTLYMGGLSISFGVCLSLVVATLINALPAYQAIFKTVYFLPNVTSAIAAAISFIYLLYPTREGWANVALSWFHLGPYGWFIDPTVAPLGMVILWVWHSVGYMALIWLAGFQTIPRDVYEAAEVDGASKFRSWWHITVPLLRPILLFLLVIEVIASFKRFADVYQIGGSDGQPGGSLATMMVYIYRYGFATFSFGIASAASVVAFVLALASTLALFALLREP